MTAGDQRSPHSPEPETVAGPLACNQGHADMTAASEIAEARHAYEDALFSGCSAAVTDPLGHQWADLENGADLVLKARRLRTAANDKLAAAERFVDSASFEVKALRFAESDLDLACAAQCIAEAAGLLAEADAVEAEVQSERRASGKRVAA